MPNFRKCAFPISGNSISGNERSCDEKSGNAHFRKCAFPDFFGSCDNPYGLRPVTVGPSLQVQYPMYYAAKQENGSQSSCLLDLEPAASINIELISKEKSVLSEIKEIRLCKYKDTLLFPNIKFPAIARRKVSPRKNCAIHNEQYFRYCC